MKELFPPGTRVKWIHRHCRNNKKIVKSGEYQKLIKHKPGYNGPQKAGIILDDRFSLTSHPVSEIVRE